MSSLTTTTSLPTGVQMGNMGEGGGGNFYQGDAPQDGKQQEPGFADNPELVVENNGQRNERDQNRQYLEELITGGRHWINPFETMPWDRSAEVRQAEQEEMKVREIKKRRNRMFIINA